METGGKRFVRHLRTFWMDHGDDDELVKRDAEMNNYK